VGAALIMPAIVALVASNFARAQRPRAYGLVASAGAIAVAAGPLIGGLFTTYLSWRWVFAGEVLIVLIILAFTRRIADTPAAKGTRLDLVGTVLSALGLGLIVYGILRAGTWGFVQPKEGAPQWIGLSPVIWLILGGGVVLRIFMSWEIHRINRGEAVLVDPAILRNRTMRGGLISFLFQYLLQAGLFFAVPLFLSVALGLSAVATGVRLLPLSITLLLAAAGVPRVFPNASPRRVVQLGFLALFAGIVILIALLNVSAGPEIITWPMLLAGLGVGALASQLGAVTVSAVPDEQSGEVGGIQNTVTNLGASIGTALSGAILIAALTSSFLAGVQNNPDVPKEVASQAQVQLSGGAPFISDKDLKVALDKAGVSGKTADAIVTENADARIDGLRSSLSVLAVIAMIALFTARRIPAKQPTGPADSEAPVESESPV
jgi:MFS family permease